MLRVVPGRCEPTGESTYTVRERVKSREWELQRRWPPGRESRHVRTRNRGALESSLSGKVSGEVNKGNNVIVHMKDGPLLSIIHVFVLQTEYVLIWVPRSWP